MNVRSWTLSLAKIITIYPRFLTRRSATWNFPRFKCHWYLHMELLAMEKPTQNQTLISYCSIGREKQQCCASKFKACIKTIVCQPGLPSSAIPATMAHQWLNPWTWSHKRS